MSMMTMTIGERIRRDRERRECIGWAVACLVMGALCLGALQLRDALRDVRPTMQAGPRR